MGGIEEKIQSLGLPDDIGLKLAGEIKKDKDSQHEWRDLARRCYDFESGEQWSAEDKALLEEQNRPPVVFNRIARTINAVAGLEIQNRQEVRYLPREMGDTGIGELLTGASKWVRDQCDAEDEESDSFRDMLICGMGWTETRMDYDDDLEGTVIIDRVDPMEMGWDRTAKKKNLDDACRIWRAKEYSKREAMARWPSANHEVGDFWEDTTEEDHMADEAWKYKHNQSETAGEGGTVTVIQVQWYERHTAHIVLSEEGQTVLFDDDKWEKVGEYVFNKGLRYQSITQKRYYQAFLSGSEVLEIGLAPCNGYSLRSMTGVRDRNRNMWLGLVVYMLDPQQWANKWLSQVMYILNTNSKGGLLAEEGAFVNPHKAEDDWSSPDSITFLNEGGLKKIQEKGQAQFPAGFDKLMEHALDAITDVTGVSMEMLGLAGASNQVGIIEASRKQSGISLLAEYFNALRRYRKEQGRVLAHYIREYISDGRMVRILGKQGEQYIPLMKQPGTIKYDIVVDDAPTSPNQKQQAFHVLMEVMPTIMAAGITPPIEALDLLPLPSSFIQAWKEQIQSQGQDPVEDQAKQLALMDKQQEIAESKSKEALNYAKVQSEGVKPVVDIEKVRTERSRQELNEFKVGVDAANPGRGML